MADPDPRPSPRPDDGTEVDRTRAGCPFCRIVDGVAPGEVVLDDDVAVGFLDVRPVFPGHVLVVPRRHVITLPELEPDEVGPLFERVRWLAEAVPAALGAQGTFVANNNVVSQSVAHLHVHVVPRTKGDGLRGFFWPRTGYDGPDHAASVAAAIRRHLADGAGHAGGVAGAASHDDPQR